MSSFPASHFDAAYFRRHYGDPETQVIGQSEVDRLCAFVLAYAAHLQLPLRSALDLGCGEGMWKNALRKQHAELRYRGVEYSVAMCRKHGWEHGSIETYEGPTADLVICQGVLQYLDDAAAEEAIRRLAIACERVLYLEALTARDWNEACEQDATDGDVFLRSGDWYRARLRDGFVDAGGGLFVRRTSGAVFYELEANGL